MKRKRKQVEDNDIQMTYVSMGCRSLQPDCVLLATTIASSEVHKATCGARQT
jgi:hypothetical protein